MSKKLRFVIGIGLMAGAVAYLIFFAVRETSEYYVTVNELQNRSAELSGQMIRVAGRVQPNQIGWDANSLTLSFFIAQPPADNTGPRLSPVVASAPAVFHVIARGEPKPDMFAAGRDVIVEGRLGPGHMIEARQVLTSCPSKYTPKDPSKGG